MSATPRPLPRFDAPPVVELAFGVQFDPLPNFKAVHFGTWRERVRRRFPIVQDQPPLDDMTEAFDNQPLRISFSLVEGLPLPRVWYVNETKTHLVQLQHNRIAYNWRKLQADHAYPSYATLREQFIAELTEFASFVQNEKLGDFKPTLCELAYINHVQSGEVWEAHSQIGRVLSIMKGEYSEPFLPDAEGFQIQSSWVFRDGADVPIGRLRLGVNPDVRATDRKPVLVLQLSGRGAPRAPTIDEVVAFMDHAHEWIVRGFAALTTPEMHKVWKRRKE